MIYEVHKVNPFTYIIEPKILYTSCILCNAVNYIENKLEDLEYDNDYYVIIERFEFNA